LKKSISLGDKRYFELFIGKRILKKQMFNSQGNIPVFSGNVSIPFGFLDRSNVSDFKHNYIIWGIDDANFDFGLILKGMEFATTDHLGAIKILDNEIQPEYLLYELKSKKKSLNFGWTFRPSLYVMRRLKVDIPIKTDGSFNIQLQRTIGKKFSMIERIKVDLKQIYEDLNETSIVISDNEIGKYVNVCLGDKRLFKVNNGERIRKKDIEKAKGNIPVYSASIFENEALGYVSEKIEDVVKGAKSFEGINLTVNADGSDYSVFIRRNKFYANDVCNVITVISPKINPYFLKYELRTQIYEKALNYSYKLYKTKLKGIEVRIPTDEKGEFDLKKQIKIANQHDQFNQKKNEILRDLEELDEAFVKVGSK